MSRIEFPKDFRWGCATAAYQIEGGVHEGSRGESIWDRFSHTSGKIRTGETGDIACDSYHRFLDDVALLREMGCTSYRFSISWPNAARAPRRLSIRVRRSTRAAWFCWDAGTLTALA